MNTRTHKSGSALLLAVLIIALVGAVGFGLIRIALLQSRVSGSTSAAIQAYHAAESGLEYGLLQYRLDGTREIPQTTVTLNSNQSFQITSTHLDSIVGTTDCLNRAATNYGSFVACDTDELHPLTYMQPDTSLTVQATQTVDSIVVRAAPADNNGTYIASQADASRGVLQIAFYQKNADGSEQLLQQQVFKLGEATGGQLLAAGGKTITGPFSFNKVTFTYLHTNAMPLALVVQCKSGGSIVNLDTGITTITAVGISQGVHRQLGARIDHQTNQVLGIFDYALHTSTASTP